MNDQNALLAALQFQIDGGVDASVGMEALDRFAELTPTSKATSKPTEVFTPSKSLAKPPHKGSPKPEQPLTHFAPGAPLLGGEIAGLPHAAAAAKAAESIPIWSPLLRRLKRHCELKKTARSTVVLDGNPAAQVLLIGEAPGSG